MTRSRRSWADSRRALRAGLVDAAPALLMVASLLLMLLALLLNQ